MISNTTEFIEITAQARKFQVRSVVEPHPYSLR